jgi:hypothetical protein
MRLRPSPHDRDRSTDTEHPMDDETDGRATNRLGGLLRACPVIRVVVATCQQKQGPTLLYSTMLASSSAVPAPPPASKRRTARLHCATVDTLGIVFALASGRHKRYRAAGLSQAR